MICLDLPTSHPPIFLHTYLVLTIQSSLNIPVITELISQAILVRVVYPLAHPVDGDGGWVLTII